MHVKADIGYYPYFAPVAMRGCYFKDENNRLFRKYFATV
jgi:hypothetical protein